MRLFRQGVSPPESLFAFQSGHRRHGGLFKKKIKKRLVFLCQLISHAIMHSAEMSLSPTDCRASGSSSAGQSMTSPSTNVMRGHKCHCVGDCHSAHTGSSWNSKEQCGLSLQICLPQPQRNFFFFFAESRFQEDVIFMGFAFYGVNDLFSV